MAGPSVAISFRFLVLLVEACESLISQLSTSSPSLCLCPSATGSNSLHLQSSFSAGQCQIASTAIWSCHTNLPICCSPNGPPVTAAAGGYVCFGAGLFGHSGPGLTAAATAAAGNRANATCTGGGKTRKHFLWTRVTLVLNFWDSLTFAIDYLA